MRFPFINSQTLEISRNILKHIYFITFPLEVRQFIRCLSFTFCWTQSRSVVESCQRETSPGSSRTSPLLCNRYRTWFTSLLWFKPKSLPISPADNHELVPLSRSWILSAKKEWSVTNEMPSEVSGKLEIDASSNSSVPQTGQGWSEQTLQRK